jgi:hypothetical protein
MYPQMIKDAEEEGTNQPSGASILPMRWRKSTRSFIRRRWQSSAAMKKPIITSAIFADIRPGTPSDKCPVAMPKRTV